MKNRSSIYTVDIRVPPGLDLEKLAKHFLQTHALDMPQRRVTDMIALLLFHLRARHDKKVSKDKISKNGRVSFHVNHRRELVGKHQKELIQFLVAEGVIDTNGRYRYGRAATKFKVSIFSGCRSWND